MKHKIIIISLIALLLLSGCSKDSQIKIIETVADEATSIYELGTVEKDSYFLIRDADMKYYIQKNRDNNPLLTFDEDVFSAYLIYEERLLIYYIDGVIELYDFSGKLLQTMQESDLRTNQIYYYDKESGIFAKYDCEKEYCAVNVSSGYTAELINKTVLQDFILVYQWDYGMEYDSFLFANGKRIGRDYKHVYYGYAENPYYNDMETNLYVIELGGSYNLMNREGQILLDEDYTYLGVESTYDNRIYYYVSEDYVVAKRNDKYGIIDVNNQIVLDFVYEQVAEIIDVGEKFVVKRDGKYGVVDNKREIILDFVYDGIIEAGGYYAVNIGHELNIINEEGNSVFPQNFYIENPYYAYLPDSNYYNNSYFLNDGNQVTLQVFDENKETIKYLMNGKQLENGTEYQRFTYDGNDYELLIHYNTSTSELYKNGVELTDLKNIITSYETPRLNDCYSLFYGFDGKFRYIDLNSEEILLEADTLYGDVVNNQTVVIATNDKTIDVYTLNGELEKIGTIEGSAMYSLLNGYYFVEDGEYIKLVYIQLP